MIFNQRGELDGDRDLLPISCFFEAAISPTSIFCHCLCLGDSLLAI